MTKVNRTNSSLIQTNKEINFVFNGKNIKVLKVILLPQL